MFDQKLQNLRFSSYCSVVQGIVPVAVLHVKRSTCIGQRNNNLQMPLMSCHLQRGYALILDICLAGVVLDDCSDCIKVPLRYELDQPLRCEHFSCGLFEKRQKKG